MSEKKMTMGVIIGNRGFFPGQLAKSGREEMIQALTKAGMDCVVLGPEESKHGAVETHEEAKRCAALFRKNGERSMGSDPCRCPTSATSAPLPTRCVWLDAMFLALVQATPDDVRPSHRGSRRKPAWSAC